MIAHGNVTTLTSISGPGGKPNKKKKEKIAMVVIDGEIIK